MHDWTQYIAVVFLMNYPDTPLMIPSGNEETEDDSRLTWQQADLTNLGISWSNPNPIKFKTTRTVLTLYGDIYGKSHCCDTDKTTSRSFLSRIRWGNCFEFKKNRTKICSAQCPLCQTTFLTRQSQDVEQTLMILITQDLKKSNVSSSTQKKALV